MLVSHLPAIALSLASLTFAVPYPSQILEAREAAVGEDSIARRYGGLEAVDRVALLARGFTDVEALDTLLKRASKSCTKTIQCRGQPIPDNSHQFCYQGSCTFGCNKGYKTDVRGKGCVSLTTTTTTTTTTSAISMPSSIFSCQKTTDCSIPLPDNSHQRCQSNVCVIGCNKGYTLNTSTATCVPVSSSSSSSSSTTSTTTGKPYTSTSAAVVVELPAPTSSSASASPAASSSSSPASPPASTTSSAPLSSKTYTGQATYFYQGGAYGACGNKFPDSAFIVAMDTRMYGDEDAQSKYCGRTVVITNNDNGKTVTATVQDACPTCESSGSLDLSVAAFKKIGLLDTGVLPISWVFA